MLQGWLYLEVVCVGLLTVYLVSGTPVKNLHDTVKDDTKHPLQDSVLLDVKNEPGTVDVDLFAGNSTDSGGWTTTDTIITCVVLGVFFLIVLPLLCFFCQLYMCCKCCCKLACCCCSDD